MNEINNFEEYKRLGEPGKLEKSAVWQTAIGLQQVDNLKTSEYLINTAKENIEGKISIDEVHERLNTYYKTQQPQAIEDRTEEADKVSARIVQILSEKTFSFSPAEYIVIHGRLFKGVLNNKIAGKIRDYNIEKAEAVLNGATVVYGSASSIEQTLKYDFDQEKKFNYEELNKFERVEHLAKFASGIWQIHAFGEGNTRATAVFMIKYLRTLGFKVENDLFAEHSLYFRNALVRANYNDLKNNIYKTNEYLFKFFRNLLLEENNILTNREMQVDGTVKLQNDTVNDTVKLQNDTVFSLIKKDSNITAVQLAQALGIGIATVKRELKRLKDSGHIERVGSDKTGSWRIIKSLEEQQF